MKKEYFKPTIMVTMLNIQSLMQNNSLTSVAGLDDVTVSEEEEFEGGASDSRRRRTVWDDYDEEEEEW